MARVVARLSQIVRQFHSKPLRYEVAAAWHGKDATQPLQLTKDREPDAGEDSFYVGSPYECKFGVADGVGGWAEHGVDPGELARELCHKINRSSLEPNKGLLVKAFQEIKKDGKVKAGGSTICMGQATQDGKLTTLNLGDSGYMIIRDDKVHYTSPPQTHYFNAPFQLSIFPPTKAYSGVIEDTPENAHMNEHSLMPGDMCLFYTDGFSDNVQLDETMKAVAIVKGIPEDRMKKEGPDVNATSVLAALLVNIARRMASSKTAETPFAKEARKFNLEWTGGKQDDITVIVVSVQDS